MKKPKSFEIISERGVKVVEKNFLTGEVTRVEEQNNGKFDGKLQRAREGVAKQQRRALDAALVAAMGGSGCE